MQEYKVLSTKKLDALLSEQAEKKGVTLTQQEFISIKPLWSKETADRLIDFADQGKKSIVFTSAAAVDMVAEHISPQKLFNWNICCLSGKTKRAVLDSGLSDDDIVCEADQAAGLAFKIIERGIKELVFCCGNKRRDDLPDRLKEAGITVYEMIVYETIETPSLITDHFDALLFFSPSAVSSFFSVNSLQENTICFAIGQTTANAILNYTANQIVVSEQPDQEIMLAAVYAYFDNKNTSVS